MWYAVLMFAAFALVDCSILEDEVARGYAQRGAMTPATFTTADIRMITQRTRPNSSDTVTCTEPSPDVAKALSAAAQLTASGGNGEVTGSLAAGGASAEAVIALAGRSTALLGLRDGLYRACEAYANGAIGADAYALVLSRYGQLMTTLFLGQDITGAAGTHSGASAQSPPVTVNLPNAPSVAAGSPAAAAPQVQTLPLAENTSMGPLALARMNEDYLNLGYSVDALVIACVNYGDPTRVATPIPPESRAQNPWLNTICPQLINIGAFSKLGKAAGDLVKARVLAPPINPAAVPPQPPRRK
jgi:hypothetical protein